MVSIAAFQAVDPGSIPGRRNFIFMPVSFNNVMGSNFNCTSLFIQYNTTIHVTYSKLKRCQSVHDFSDTNK